MFTIIILRMYVLKSYANEFQWNELRVSEPMNGLSKLLSIFFEILESFLLIWTRTEFRRNAILERNCNAPKACDAFE